jgi:hypothetical protein
MTIRWPNVVALALAVFALVVGLKCSRQIGELFSGLTAAGAGQGPGPDGRVLGLMAFGLVLVVVVAIVRILQNNRSDK